MRLPPLVLNCFTKSMLFLVRCFYAKISFVKVQWNGGKQVEMCIGFDLYFKRKNCTSNPQHCNRVQQVLLDHWLLYQQPRAASSKLSGTQSEQLLFFDLLWIPSPWAVFFAMQEANPITRAQLFYYWLLLLVPCYLGITQSSTERGWGKSYLDNAQIDDAFLL